MSKIGNYRVEMQETGDYMFGWNSAERGEPRPISFDPIDDDPLSIKGQQMGWDDFHASNTNDR